MVCGIRKMLHRHYVEGIEAFGQDHGDGPCLTPIEQNWEDVGPVEVHLSVCIYVGPPGIEAESLSGHLFPTVNVSITSLQASRCLLSHCHDDTTVLISFTNPFLSLLFLPDCLHGS